MVVLPDAAIFGSLCPLSLPKTAGRGMDRARERLRDLFDHIPQMGKAKVYPSSEEGS
jgi:hypothetical protein